MCSRARGLKSSSSSSPQIHRVQRQVLQILPASVLVFGVLAFVIHYTHIHTNTHKSTYIHTDTHKYTQIHTNTHAQTREAVSNLSVSESKLRNLSFLRFGPLLAFVLDEFLHILSLHMIAQDAFGTIDHCNRQASPTLGVFNVSLEAFNSK